MRFFILSFSLTFYSISNILTGQVTLLGNNPSYAGSEIAFQMSADPFTGEEIEIGKCEVTTTGDFSLTLPLKETTYIFSHLGIFKGFLTVEPGKNYTISFPDKTDKTPANKMNPFFEETEFQFAIKNISDNDINFLIMAFDDAYKPYLKKFVGNIYSRNAKNLIDTTVTNLKKIGINENDDYFIHYADYKIGYLKNLAYQQKSKSISKEYFQQKPILYNNPGYFQLFNQVYAKYFYFFGRTNSGKQIYTDINLSKSYYNLSKTLTSDSILQNDSLRELVILKNIHDEFYAANFSRSGLLAILDSLTKETKITKHKEIAGFIRNKITRLMQDYEPPQFSLYDKEGKLVKLEDFKGKYVYLNFCSCSSYSCIKEFDVLKKLAEKYKDYKFAIVTIATDETREQMAHYVNKNQLNWVFLHFGNQPEVLKQYDIRAYPTYYLIGPDGKLILSPANSPGENFEMELFKIMRSKGDA